MRESFIARGTSASEARDEAESLREVPTRSRPVSRAQSLRSSLREVPLSRQTSPFLGSLFASSAILSTNRFPLSPLLTLSSSSRYVTSSAPLALAGAVTSMNPNT